MPREVVERTSESLPTPVDEGGDAEDDAFRCDVCWRNWGSTSLEGLLHESSNPLAFNDGNDRDGSLCPLGKLVATSGTPSLAPVIDPGALYRANRT